MGKHMKNRHYVLHCLVIFSGLILTLERKTAFLRRGLFLDQLVQCDAIIISS
jgi:hypothetical protein